MCGLDNNTFAELMRQYQKLVYTVCYQFVHNPDTAQDLTQDTFLSAYSGIDRCDPAYYRQWLVRVAANKCKDHLRSAWVRKVDAPGEEAMPEPTAELAPASVARSPEQSLMEKDGAAALREMIRSLREPYGSVATLYLLDEKTVPDIAKTLGRPEKTVQNQIFRAKVILRGQLSERGQS